MKVALASFETRIAPAEKIFFTWLPRVFATGVLVGCAWIDDAPPLELAAILLGIYVAFRVALQFGPLSSAAPFQNPILSALFALMNLVILVFAFLIIVTFINRIALSVVG